MRVLKDARKKVFDRAERLRNETIDLVSDLVKIPSENPGYLYTKDYFEKGYTKLYDEPVTFGGEKKVAEFLEPLVRELGAKTEMVAKHPLRPNLVGFIKGTQGDRSLAVNAHIDTVPTGLHEDWEDEDPFSGKVKDGKVWGRGATDDKGPLVSLLEGVKAIISAGYKLKGDLQIHFTVGEETGEGKTLGPGYMIQKDSRFRTDAALIAEASAPPHQLGICTTGSGVSWLNITVKGKPVHAAMYYRTIRTGYEGHEVGVSAVNKAYKIYRALMELEQEWALKKDETGLIPEGFATIPQGWVYGHPSGIELPFFVADHCEIGMAVWRNPKEKYEDVKAEVDRVIKNVVDSDPWMRDHPPIVDWRLDWPAFSIDRDHRLTRSVERGYLSVMGPPAKYMAWQPVSDARWYQENGVPSLLIGPGDYRVAHAVDEYIEIEPMISGAKIYAQAIMDFLGYEE